jgi:predicted GNAT family N-acyltransferase
MRNPLDVSVTRALWSRDAAALRAVRTAVFVVEQRVPPALEWDGRDGDCVHVLARTGDGTAVGCGRLLPEGRIGRMAVLAAMRGRGVGSALMRALLTAAREHGHTAVELGAQTHALGFYARFGFIAEGAEYDDAGMPHRTMRLALK